MNAVIHTGMCPTEQACSARSRICEKRPLRLSRQSVYSHVSARILLGGFTWRDFIKMCLEIPKLFKTGQSVPQFTWRPKCVLLLPATWNRCRSVLFEWNGYFESRGSVNITQTLYKHCQTCYISHCGRLGTRTVTCRVRAVKHNNYKLYY